MNINERAKIRNMFLLIRDITNRLYNDIDEVMRNRGRTNDEIAESLIYIIEEWKVKE